MWPRVWQMACREEHIPEPGDTKRVIVTPGRAVQPWGVRRDKRGSRLNGCSPGNPVSLRKRDAPRPMPSYQHSSDNGEQTCEVTVTSTCLLYCLPWLC